MKFRAIILFLFLFAIQAAGQSGSQSTETPPQNSDVKILSKPNARHPDEMACAQGTVRLKVAFLATGEIGKIVPVTGLSFLTESAIEAAKKIKFIPKRVNGKNVSIVKSVEYKFGIY
ncbi:MAG: energy transducer TonB [Pyrinomonadaceae bacterium]|nr:energy transducer TonB [Pyrinomonadaceae bacterium]